METMTTTVSSEWKGNALQQYLLVIPPDSKLKDRISSDNSSLLNTDQRFAGQQSIVVASFEAREAMEETIIRYIERICLQQSRFPVILNNYGGFPPEIFLRVQNPEPFRHIARSLKAVADYIISCGCPTPNLVANPHVTVASGIPENIFLPTMMEVAQRSFHDIFIADELLLVRKIPGSASFKRVNVFRLQPADKKVFN